MLREGVVGLRFGEVMVARSCAALYGLLEDLSKVLGILKGAESFMLHMGDSMEVFHNCGQEDFHVNLCNIILRNESRNPLLAVEQTLL